MEKEERERKEEEERERKERERKEKKERERKEEEERERLEKEEKERKEKKERERKEEEERERKERERKEKEERERKEKEERERKEKEERERKEKEERERKEKEERERKEKEERERLERERPEKEERERLERERKEREERERKKEERERLEREERERLEKEEWERKEKEERERKEKEEREVTPVKVLLVGDEYGTSKGGVSTMNLNVSRKLSAAGAEVYVTVLKASDKDEEEAKRDGVTLLKPHIDPYSTMKPSLHWLTVYHKHHFKHIPPDISWIVGHVDVTSKAARNIKEERFPHAKLAMFGHLAPEETEFYRSDERVVGVGKKEASIRKDLAMADVVFSVGARIYRHFDWFLCRKKVAHHMFLPEPSKVFIKADVSFGESKGIEKPERVVLSIGRVRNVEKLKSHDLTAGALDKVALRLDHQYTLRLRVRGINENDFKESTRIMEEKLRSGRVKPTLLPYGTQEDIRRDMEECHLVVMASRAEPFGLVGLEAIAAGVPVLISKHSGLAELIEELSVRLGQPSFRHCVVKMTGDTVTDTDKWAERIEDVLSHAETEFAAARAFKEKLLVSKYWEESYQKFLQALGITASDPFELAMADPEMRALYDQACKEGTYKMFNIMLMLVGKKRNGKSSLKKSLLCLAFNKHEKITDSLEITACLTKEKDNWKMMEGRRDADSELAVAVGLEMKTKQQDEKKGEDLDNMTDKKEEEESEQTVDTDPAVEGRTDTDYKPAFHVGMEMETERVEEKEQDPGNMTDKKEEEESEHPAVEDQPAKDDAGREERIKKAVRFVKGEDDLSNIVGSKEHPTISIWDFAGQEIYYSNNHVLYSPHAIYILTLDLRKPLDAPLDHEKDQSGSGAETLQLETEGDLVDYHLESIRAHTRRMGLPDNEPHVIVVGTHKDQVNQEKIDLFSNILEHFEDKAIHKHVHGRPFAIDNTKRDPEDPELSDLRDCILKIAQKQSHMGKEIPISWLQLKSKLMEMEKQGRKHCSLQDVMDATDSSRVPEEDAVKILKFFHLCGDILYFDTQELRNFVVLDPQWFVDVQKTIITIPKYQLDGKPEEWTRLKKEGVLKGTLVHAVWGNKEKQKALKCDLIAHKDELLKMMEQFDVVLQCSPESNDATGTTTSSPADTTYFVPSLLAVATKEVEAKLFPKGTKCSKPIFVKFNDKFFPIGLYHRLVIACMRRYKKKTPVASANCARFVTDNKKQTFVITKERHYLKVELVSSEKEESACFSHGPAVREGLEKDLRRIIGDWIPGIGFKWCFCCCCESHIEEREEDRLNPIIAEDVKEWFEDGEAVCDKFDPATSNIEDIGLAHWYLNPHKDAEQPSPAGVPSASGPRGNVEDYFDHVITNVSCHWKKLARKLGIVENQIESIDKKKNGDDENCRVVLNRWRNENADAATLQALQKALTAIGQKQLAQQLGQVP